MEGDIGQCRKEGMNKSFYFYLHHYIKHQKEIRLPYDVHKAYLECNPMRSRLIYIINNRLLHLDKYSKQHGTRSCHL